MAEQKKYIGLESLGHFLLKLKDIFAAKEEVPVPPGDASLYYDGEGNWTSPKASGGMGLFSFGVEGDDLYLYYDDGMTGDVPTFSIEGDGCLYVSFGGD